MLFKSNQLAISVRLALFAHIQTEHSSILKEYQIRSMISSPDINNSEGA